MKPSSQQVLLLLFGSFGICCSSYLSYLKPIYISIKNRPDNYNIVKPFMSDYGIALSCYIPLKYWSVIVIHVWNKLTNLRNRLDNL